MLPGSAMIVVLAWRLKPEIDVILQFRIFVMIPPCTEGIACHRKIFPACILQRASFIEKPKTVAQSQQNRETDDTPKRARDVPLGPDY